MWINDWTRKRNKTKRNYTRKASSFDLRWGRIFEMLGLMRRNFSWMFLVNFLRFYDAKNQSCLRHYYFSLPQAKYETIFFFCDHPLLRSDMLTSQATEEQQVVKIKRSVLFIYGTNRSRLIRFIDSLQIHLLQVANFDMKLCTRTAPHQLAINFRS